MAKTLIGYARCSTDKRDLSAQRKALTELGVTADRIYVDLGRTHETGQSTISLEELFSISRPTVYRALLRRQAA